MSHMKANDCARGTSSRTIAAFDEAYSDMDDASHNSDSPDRLPRQWQSAWNRHDVAALASMVAPDADFITVAGVWLRGRDEFIHHHHALHQLQMRESVWTTVGVGYRALCGNLLLAHVEWAIAGDRDPDGSARTPRRGHFTWVLQADPHWKIVVAQNTNLGAHAAHRLIQPTRGAST